MISYRYRAAHSMILCTKLTFYDIDKLFRAAHSHNLHSLAVSAIPKPLTLGSLYVNQKATSTAKSTKTPANLKEFERISKISKTYELLKKQEWTCCIERKRL